MNERIQPQAAAVNRVAIEHGLVEVTGLAQAIERAIDRGVAGRRGIFRSHHGGGLEIGAVGGVENGPHAIVWHCGSAKQVSYVAFAAQLRRRKQGIKRGLANILVAALQQLLQDKGRRNAIQATAHRA